MNRKMMNLGIGLCFACVATLLAAACSQNDFDDKQGEPLPDGKYPMTFATTVEGVTATRATTDNTWAGTEEVAVQVGSGNPKKYTPAAGGTSVTLQAATGETPFYWESTSNINVSAWYYGTGYNATPPTSTSWSWSVQSKQNEKDGYQQSDFLYAPAKSIAFNPQAGADNSLTFYHQTAKVIINIRKEGILTDASKITSVVIGNNSNIALKGTYTAPTGNNTAGTWTPATDGTGTITPKTLANPNTGVSFGSGTTENALASYEALVIPQTVTTGENFIGIMVDRTNFWYKAEIGSNELKAGYVHTYNITVKGEELSVTTSQSSIGWSTEGAASTGSVTLPETYDLNTAQPITINDDRTYLITGTGTQGVTISGSPTVILNGVTLNTSTSPSISITGGSPKLTFKGTNTLGTKGGIALSNNAEVTIEGDGAQNTILNIEGEYGIGVYKDDNKCGNITISDIALNIECEGAGVGATTESTCGNISLTSCKLNISSTYNAACIGTSAGSQMYKPVCGNIELRDCEIINLTAGNAYDSYPAAIGCSGGGKCGNIDIYLRDNETVDDFLTKITVNDSGDKVGKGFNKNVETEIGTVTWYNHAGTKVGEGAKK